MDLLFNGFLYGYFSSSGAGLAMDPDGRKLTFVGESLSLMRNGLLFRLGSRQPGHGDANERQRAFLLKRGGQFNKT